MPGTDPGAKFYVPVTVHPPPLTFYHASPRLRQPAKLPHRGVPDHRWRRRVAGR